MTPPAPSAMKELFDPRRDEYEVGQLSLMVLLTQGVGLVLIFFGLRLLTNYDRIWPRATVLLWIGGIVTILWGGVCWYDLFVNLGGKGWDRISNWGQDEDATEVPVSSPLITPVSAPIRKTRILRGILALVVADNCLLASFIVISGGPGHSSLDPLLPMIVIIAIILRQPVRTVAVALGFELLVVLVGFALHFVAVHNPELYDEWVYDSHKDSNFVLAFALVAAGSVVLSALEYRIIHPRPKLARGIIPSSVRHLSGTIPNLKARMRAISRGKNSWIKWLTHRGIPAAELSLVHGDRNVVNQAIILTIPYWTGETSLSLRQKRRITRHITFLTFAAHWIDDHFDALTTHCVNPQTRANSVLYSEQNYRRIAASIA